MLSEEKKNLENTTAPYFNFILKILKNYDFK